MDHQQQIFVHLDGTDLERSTRVVVSEEHHHLRLIWAGLANHGVRMLNHVHRSGTTNPVLLRRLGEPDFRHIVADINRERNIDLTPSATMGRPPLLEPVGRA